MKKSIRLFAVLLALLLPAAALAELELQPVFRYMPSIVSVEGTGYVIVGDKTTSQKGVFTTDGQEVLACRYPNLTSAGNCFFTVQADKEKINSRAIVCLDGRTISDSVYGYVITYNRHWVAGCVLSEASEEKNDVKISGKFYWIERWDVFYVDDEVRDSYLVGSLGDRSFAKAKVHGQYISVQDRSGAVKVYDRSFQPLDIQATGVNANIYTVENYAVKDPGTGRVVLQDYVTVTEADTPDGLLLIASRYHWTGEKHSSVFDDQGTLLYETDLEITSATRDYALFTSNRKTGLYDLRAGKVLVPALYDKIITSSTALDAYVFNGYVMVQLNDLRGFVDTRTGEVSCEIKYSPSGLKRAGCAFYYAQEDGSILLVAADGVESRVSVGKISSLRGDGTLLASRKGEYYGMIDWHGQEVLPFIHNREIIITDDSFGIIRTSTGMELDRIVR